MKTQRATSSAVLIEAERAFVGPCEVLPARQWCRLLGIREQSFRKRCDALPMAAGRRQLFAYDTLPADYRATLEALRAECHAPSFVVLLRLLNDHDSDAWQPPKPWLQYGAGVRRRAEMRRDALAVWFAARARGATKQDAAKLVSEENVRLCGKAVCARQVFRWIAVIEARGGEAACLAAYCDEKEAAKPGRRLHVPEEFLSAVRSKVLEPGVGVWTAAVRVFQLDWRAGAEVPGLGARQHDGQPFPFSAKQLQKFCPSKAARVTATRGKFAAKAAGLLPAPPVSRRNVRAREIITFDDYRIDVIALADDTGRPCSLSSCFALDEGSGQILGYIIRSDGALRAADTEGLTSFILRVPGFAGRRAGYATTLKFERGTVAISREREALLCGMFPGEILVSRTAMIGGAAPGGFQQKASGNFFGKGRLESFFKTLGLYLRHVAGQRGSGHAESPAVLGDTTLTPETMAHPLYKLKFSQIEEATACAQVASAEHYRQTGAENILAFEASAATGIRPPLLFVSEVHAAIRAAIEFYNDERGHRREGFAEIIVPGADGVMRPTIESANDKAARLLRALSEEGRSLTQISAADAAVLLRKVKRVTVRPGGVRVRIGGEERRYWHPDSLAVLAAQQSSHGQKEYLALFNPDDPRELHLLHNAPGHFPPSASELPSGVEPVYFEALPLYTAPDANDEKALAARAASVARNHGRVMLEISRATLPFTAAQTARREANLDAAEPLRAAVSVLREEAAKVELPATQIGVAFEARAEEAAKEKYLASLRRVAKQQAEAFDER